jgi:hypothetical protein
MKRIAAFLLALIVATSYAADTKISDMSSGTAPASGDLFLIARSGANYKLTWAQMLGNATATILPSAGNSFNLGNGSGKEWLNVYARNLALGDSGASAFLTYDAANTLAQRNGTSAQFFNVYKTYTSATNYERLRVGSDGTNYFLLSGPGSGGGSHRPMYVGYDQSVANSASPLIFQGGGAAGATMVFNIGNVDKITLYDTAGRGPAVAAGTATTDVAALSVTRTNNNAAVATGVQIAYTDTLSSPSFLPFQVLGGAAGTTNLFGIQKTGALSLPGGAVATPQIHGDGTIVNGATTGIFWPAAGNGQMGFSSHTGQIAEVRSTGFMVGAAGLLFGANFGGGEDTNLNRISAGIVGCGTGAAGSTACTFRAAALAAGGSDFTVTAANSVSPTSPNRTITVSYGGTTYYVAAKTTND